jgi:hypothetical protein
MNKLAISAALLLIAHSGKTMDFFFQSKSFIIRERYLATEPKQC